MIMKTPKNEILIKDNFFDSIIGPFTDQTTGCSFRLLNSLPCFIFALPCNSMISLDTCLHTFRLRNSINKFYSS